MHIHELVAAARYIRKYLEESELSRRYGELIEAVQQAANNQNPERVAQLRASLLSIHEEAGRQALGPATQRLLQEFGADELIGVGAKARLRKIFEDNQAHPQGLVLALQALQADTNSLASRASGLTDALGPMLEDVDADKAMAPDEGTLWLFFEHRTSVETLPDLEKAAETWKEVLHHFSRLPDASYEEGRLLYVKKGSPLALEIAAGAAVLLPIAYAVKFVISCVGDVVHILKEKEELRRLRMGNDVLELVHAEAMKRKDDIAEAGADAIVEAFGGDGETRNAIALGVRSIVEFVVDGGVLDVGAPEQATPDTAAENADQAPSTSIGELKKAIESLHKELKRLPPSTLAALQDGDVASDPEEENAG